MSDDTFVTFDAPYVLGALTQADRVTFEAHLRTCDACIGRVLDMREVAGLLAAAPPGAFDGSAPPPPPHEANRGDDDPLLTLSMSASSTAPATLLPRLLKEVARQRRRRRSLVGAVAGVAAGLAVAAAVVLSPGGGGIPTHAPSEASMLINVVPAPISVQARIVTTNTWARVDLWCSYSKAATIIGTYTLVATSKDGTTRALSSWPGVPGQTTVLRVPTQLHTGDIVSLEIQGSSGLTLSRLTL